MKTTLKYPVDYVEKIVRGVNKIFPIKIHFKVFLCVNFFGKERRRVKKILKMLPDGKFHCNLIKVMCILYTYGKKKTR